MGGFDRLQHMLAELKAIAQRTLLSMANIDDSLGNIIYFYSY